MIVAPYIGAGRKCLGWAEKFGLPQYCFDKEQWWSQLNF